MLLIPHHVTGFWLPHYTDNPLTTGSLGAGLLLDYAVATYREEGIYYNEARIGGGPGVDIRSPYPLGYGYAGSAVLNIAKHVRLHGLSLRAFQEAHIAEVTAGTGLGDVLAIYAGGCLVVRYRPGAPGVGHAEGYDCPPLAAVTVHTRRVETRDMLRGLHKLLEVEGRRAVERAAEGDLSAFLEAARSFALAVGFLPKELDAEISKLRGVVGHYAKKGVLVLVVEPDHAEEVASHVRRLGPVKTCTLKRRAVTAHPPPPPTCPTCNP